MGNLSFQNGDVAKNKIMKLKFIITIFLAIILSEFSFANFYKKGDTLNVWAASGLNMREGPGIDFPKIKKLEYGKKVEVIDQYLRSTPINITVVKKSKKSDEFVLKGFWVRVKFGTREGYVFDRYLSRLPVINFIKNEKGEKISEGFVSYADREFGLKLHEDVDHPDLPLQEKFLFKNNMELNYKSAECFGMNINLGSLSFNEAYLFFNHIGKFENILKNVIPKHPDDLYKIEFKENKDHHHSISYSNEGNGISLNWKDGKFIYEYWSCC